MIETIKYRFKTNTKKLLADTLTPVNIYLKLRDVYAGSILLESSDYRGNQNALSIICCQPIAFFKLESNIITTKYPDGEKLKYALTPGADVIAQLNHFMQTFDLKLNTLPKYPFSGLFGYMAYDSVRYFENIRLKDTERFIPDIFYQFFQYVIVVDHFSNELILFEHLLLQEESELDRLQQIISNYRIPLYPFKLVSEEQNEYGEKEFLSSVNQAINHCQRGDVFQMVLSRKFSSAFRGDEFNVYRALRSINPSPYLFYFDFGSFKLFGSSPEAQLKIKGNKASIFPIAGTFRRTGNDEEDAALARKLVEDEKENAEHIMLVDLARNDLSRHASGVQVEVFREIQFYSHVIHLVSTVSGRLEHTKDALSLVADTFPAGTLSGAPKHKAMQLIDKYEPFSREFYGGAIGFLGFDGTFNHAIMIRSFMSRDNQLYYQAGAGIVAKSIPENELQEVNNKLEALRKAIQLAEKI